MSNRRKQLNKEEILAIPKLFETMNGEEIARKYGCSRSTVVRWVKELRKMRIDIPDSKRGRPKTLC